MLIYNNMKVRNGFVSNSSSSSFVVINRESRTSNFNKYINKNFLHIPYDLDNPYYEFGWEFKRFDRFEDKLCWAYLQSFYYIAEHHALRYTPMIDKTVDVFLNIKDIKNDLTISSLRENYPELDLVEGYIDHQSAYPERSLDDLEIFKSKENLKYFLFFDSYIECGNDNETAPEPAINKIEKKVEIKKEEIIKDDDLLLTEKIVKIAREQPNLGPTECKNLAMNQIKLEKLREDIKRKAASISYEALQEYYITTEIERLNASH